MTAPAKPPRSWRGLLVPAMLAFALLIGLGTWQLQRTAWKEGLIAALDARLAAPPIAVPPPSAWSGLDPASDEYRHVALTAQFDYADEALVFAAASAFRPDVSGLGYWVFTPARLAGGGVVFVNRGFVPDGRQDAKSRQAGDVAGPLSIVGVLRWPEGRHWFSPADEPAHDLWYTRDPAAIAAAKGLGVVAPFYVEQESPVPPGGLPKPGKLVVTLPDNHLQYAITWYGLALVLLVMFVSYAASRGGSRPGGDGQRPRRSSPSL